MLGEIEQLIAKPKHRAEVIYLIKDQWGTSKSRINKLSKEYQLKLFTNRANKNFTYLKFYLVKTLDILFNGNCK